MRKILLVLLIVLLSSFVSGALTDNMKGYYSFDVADVTGSTLIDLSPSSNNGTCNMASGCDTVPGHLLNASDFDGVGDYASLGNVADWNIGSSNFTIVMWYNGTSNNEVLMGRTTGAEPDRWQIGIDNVHKPYFWTNGFASFPNSLRALTSTNDGAYHHFVIKREANTFRLFLDNSNEANYTSVETLNPNTAITIGWGSGGTYFTGDIDETGIVVGSAWSDAEIAQSYNSGIGLNPYGSAPTPGTTINVSSPKPNNNTQFNVNSINFNTTVNATNIFNCSLYINSTLNETISNFGSGNNVFVNFTKTMDEGTWEFYISCFDNISITNTSTNLFYIDTVFPLLTTNFNNLSAYYLNNLTGQFNVSDETLIHSVLVKIDSTIIDNITGIGSKTYSYNLSYDPITLSVGTHILNFTFSDGHTSEVLLDPNAYNPSNGLFNNYMKYDFDQPYEDNYIKIQGLEENIFDTFTTEFNGFDRYKIKYKPNNKKTEYKFKVESDEEIFIAETPNNNFGGQWLIIGDHWLDFYLKNQPNLDVSVERINKNFVEVTVSGLDSSLDELEFNSIGDLNKVSSVYNFFKGNATFSYENTTFELTDQTITLKLNKTSYVNTSANLYYDGVLKSTTKTSFSTYDLYSSTFNTPSINQSIINKTINWTYSFISTIIENQSEEFNQTVIQIKIDNCSTYTTRSMNISLRNQSDNALVIGSIAGYLQVYIQNIGSFRPFNLSFSGDSQYGICIDPSSASYLTTSQFEYYSPSFSNIKNYYFVNNTLDNNTDILNLYFADGETLLTITVTDQDDNPLNGAYVYILKYNLPTNSFEISEIVKTASDGIAIGHVVLSTQRYKFRVQYENEFVLETSDRILLLDTLNLRVNLVTDYFNNYDVVQNVTCGLSYDNSTQTFTLDYTDPSSSLSQACLNVRLETSLNSNLLNQSCSTSAAGSLIASIPGNLTTSGFYSGTGLITLDNQIFTCTNLVQQFNNDFQFYGTEGVMTSFLFVLTMAMIGVWSPAASAILTIVSLVVSNLFGIFHLGYASLIVLVILGGVVAYKSTR